MHWNVPPDVLPGSATIGPLACHVPLFARGTFCERLRVACTKAVAAELMNVSGLWDLNEQKIQEYLCLLVFVWSPRSERWPR